MLTINNFGFEFRESWKALTRLLISFLMSLMNVFSLQRFASLLLQASNSNCICFILFYFRNHTSGSCIILSFPDFTNQMSTGAFVIFLMAFQNFKYWIMFLVLLYQTVETFNLLILVYLVTSGLMPIKLTYLVLLSHCHWGNLFILTGRRVFSNSCWGCI